MTSEGPGRPASDAQVLAGRYRLDERIGVGAMGEVWRATDLRLQREVAVKRIRLDGHVDTAAQARFQREAIAMAGVSHPNVVSVYDSGTDAGDGRTAYLVMELLDGPSCAELIGRARSLSLGEVERIGAGVARGLAAAHAAGVVHRDIKPSNVVVSRGVPKIVDFGIARLEQEATSTLTAPQTTIGTAAYMSPEQALGKPVGPASDVYSLGALLVALASGSPPFGAANSLAIMRAHVDDAPPSLANLRDDAPPQLVTLVERMLAKAPASRPTATEVAGVLEGGELPPQADAETEDVATVAAGALPGPTPASPPRTEAYPQPAPIPPSQREPRRRRRGGALWWLVAAALLVLALGIGANALLDGQDGGATPEDSGATATATESVVTPTREATTEPVAPAPPTEDPAERDPAEEPPAEDPPAEDPPEGDPAEEPPEGARAPEGDAGADLAASVATAGAAIDAVEDDSAREELARRWQPASSGLQGTNAADQLRAVLGEADSLAGEGLVTSGERDAIAGAIEDVIALL